MAASQKHVRIRLRFSPACHEPSWLFVNRSNVKTMSDLADFIQLKFPNTLNCSCLKLMLANFALPTWESTEMLQNGDVLRVQLFDNDQAMQTTQQESCDVQQRPRMEAGCGTSDLLGSAVKSPAEIEITTGKDRKRKKKKRREEEADRRCEGVVSPEGSRSGVVDQDGVSVCKKRKKSSKVRELEPIINDSEPVINDSEPVINHSDQNGGEPENLREREAIVDQCNVGEDSMDGSPQSALLGRESSNKNKEPSDTNGVHKDTESINDENVSKPYENPKETTDKNSPSEMDGTKKQRRRRRKRKKPLETEVSNVSASTFNQVSSTFSHGKPKKTQPLTNSHKHFGDSDEECSEITENLMNTDQVDETRGGNSEENVVMFDGDSSLRDSSHKEDYCSYNETDSDVFHDSYTGVKSLSLTESSLKNGTSVFTRKRKKRFPDLSKQQQLNTVATNKSVIFQNPISEGLKVTNGVSEVIPVVKSYDNFPLLRGPPRSGDQIAYKILELTADYCPEVSAYKVGRAACNGYVVAIWMIMSAIDFIQEGTVVDYNPVTEMVSLKLALPDTDVKAAEAEPRKFDISIEDEDVHLTNVTQQTNEISLEWNLLLQPRLLV